MSKTETVVSVEDNKQDKKKYPTDLKYHREYYKNNKDKYQGYLKEMIHCEVCKKDVRRYSVARHNKTKKHLKGMAQMKGNQSMMDLLKDMQRKLDALQSKQA